MIFIKLPVYLIMVEIIRVPILHDRPVVFFVIIHFVRLTYRRIVGQKVYALIRGIYIYSMGKSKRIIPTFCLDLDDISISQKSHNFCRIPGFFDQIQKLLDVFNIFPFKVSIIFEMDLLVIALDILFYDLFFDELIVIKFCDLKTILEKRLIVLRHLRTDNGRRPKGTIPAGGIQIYG